MKQVGSRRAREISVTASGTLLAEGARFNAAFTKYVRTEGNLSFRFPRGRQQSRRCMSGAGHCAASCDARLNNGRIQPSRDS
jgi:hypothetical protein